MSKLAWVALAAGLAACRSDGERVELPGLSVWLPFAISERRAVDYTYGRVDAWVRRQGGVLIAWGHDATLPDEDEEIEALLEWHGYTLDAATPVARVHPAPGLETATYDMKVGERTMPVTVIACGRRHVVVITAVHTRERVERVHGRVVASLRCTPDPVEEERVGRPPPLIVKLPPAWEPLDYDPLWKSHAGEDGALHVFYLRDSDSPRTIEAILESWFEDAGRVSVDRVTDAEWSGRLIPDEDPEMPVRARVIPCGHHRAIGVLFGTEKAALDSIRCE